MLGGLIEAAHLLIEKQNGILPLGAARAKTRVFPRIWQSSILKTDATTTRSEGGSHRTKEVEMPSQLPNEFAGLPSARTHESADVALMREDEVARLLGIAPKTLRHWRVAGSPLPYVKLGRRLVRYRRSDVLAYIERNISSSTSQEDSHA